jgi:hypothetical protein
MRARGSLLGGCLSAGECDPGDSNHRVQRPLPSPLLTPHCLQPIHRADPTRFPLNSNLPSPDPALPAAHP